MISILQQSFFALRFGFAKWVNVTNKSLKNSEKKLVIIRQAGRCESSGNLHFFCDKHQSNLPG